jgi:EpsI family protein
MPLVASLAQVVPLEIAGFTARDVVIAEGEAQVAGFSNYLFRVYEAEPSETDSFLEAMGAPDSLAVIEDTSSTRAAPSTEDSLTTGEAPATGDARTAGNSPEKAEAAGLLPWFSLYVGYYESQAQGNTIHSPKNCLPGAGWEAISSEARSLSLEDRTVTVNRYILQNEGERALVLYWYQGRGRIAHDEYRVKLDLLKDAALHRRSDEALVRIVVPVLNGDDDAAEALAVNAAQVAIPSIELALPPG